MHELLTHHQRCILASLGVLGLTTDTLTKKDKYVLSSHSLFGLKLKKFVCFKVQKLFDELTPRVPLHAGKHKINNIASFLQEELIYI